MLKARSSSWLIRVNASFSSSAELAATAALATRVPHLGQYAASSGILDPQELQYGMF